MARIHVNQVEQPEGAQWETWGTLLEALDSQLAPNGQIVTAVRFDGLDEAAFRDPEVMARPLTGVALVEVDRGTTADLIGRTVGEVTAALAALASEAGSVGEAFRRFDIPTANASLSELATKLNTLISIVQAIGLALRLNLDEFRYQNESAAAMTAELAGFVDAIITAQRAEDWIGVADVVEYDLQPALPRWQAMVSALGAMAGTDVLEAAS